MTTVEQNIKLENLTLQVIVTFPKGKVDGRHGTYCSLYVLCQ